MGLTLKVTQQVTSIDVTEVKVTELVVAPFDVANQAIPKAIGEAKGDLVGFSAASTPVRIPKGTDGQVVGYDSTQPSGVKPVTIETGGGSATLTNKSGSNLALGAVVITDPDNDKAFKTTTLNADRRILGVLGVAIDDQASGKVLVGPQLATVLVQGNVARGEWIVASTTAGRAKAGGFTRPFGAIGIALTAYAGGGAGSVEAILSIDHYLGASKGTVWTLGGYNGGYIGTASKFPVATETWANVAGAALSAVRSMPSAIAAPATKAIILGGNDSGPTYKNTADRLTYATEVTAAVAGANLPAARGGLQQGPYSSTDGYTAGGYNAGDQSTNTKTGFSAETSANTTGLPAVRSVHGTAQATSFGYIAGGGATPLATIVKLTFSSDASANLGNSLSAARSGLRGTNGGTDAYFSGGTTGAAVLATTDKMPFGTETPAAVSGAALTTAKQSHGAGMSDLAGYHAGGHNGTAVDFFGTGGTRLGGTDKLVFATDTCAVVTGGGMPENRAGMGGTSAAV